MRKLFVLASLVLASCFFSGFANAQSKLPAVHYRHVQYAPAPYPPPVSIPWVCTINGEDFPVDAGGWIWAWVYAEGRWDIIGRIWTYPWGRIAIMNNGARYPAYCRPA